jgi:hypothetical protein
MTSQHPLAIAARQPLALLVLAATILMAIFVELWILPLGLIAYAATVWTAANDPALMAPKVEQPKLAKITSRTFQAQLDGIDRTRDQIVRTTESVKGPLARLLQPIAVQATELYNQANGLADKGQIIEQYLQSTQSHNLQFQIESLDQRIVGTSDQYTLDQLKATRAALIDRQQNSQALATYYDRITAQLQNIGANLDNVLAETVRLRAAEVATASQASSDVAERLSNLNADMDAFQHVLEGALSQSGAA